MKKVFLSVVLALVAVLALVGCKKEKLTPEYALVTDVGDIDDHSFNQTSWEAVEAYAKSVKKGYAYYRPTEDSQDARVTAIRQAVAAGAKVVVCPGFLFETALYEVQDELADTKFILLDGTPNNGDYDNYQSKVGANVCSIIYQEQIAGYLAGYAAVKEGYTKLGFCGGMAVPAVIRYGYGYVQGADAAAQEMNVDVTINYYYAGAFQATAHATALMESWYTAGTEVVFACGGKVYQSVKTGASGAAASKWIGVDVDQTADDAAGKVLTSACKGLANSVQTALEMLDAGKWAEIGGQTWNLGLGTKLGTSAQARNYVELPTANWNLTGLTKTAYEQLLADIVAGTVTVDGQTDAQPTVSAKVTMNYVATPEAEA